MNRQIMTFAACLGKALANSETLEELQQRIVLEFTIAYPRFNVTEFVDLVHYWQSTRAVNVAHFHVGPTSSECPACKAAKMTGLDK